MWTTTIKQLSFNGTVSVSIGGATPPLPLRGVRVDVYRFEIDPEGNTQFKQLNQAAERTSETGDFSFKDLPVSVQVQTVIPGSPPYTPIEIINPGSLPNLGFRVSIEAEVLTSGISQGNQFIDIYDERVVISSDLDWITSHPERLNVVLSGSSSIPVLIPEDNEEAVLVGGITLPPPPIPGQQFHFLRVGRATRDEIGVIGTTKPGYMNSVSPSFFPGIVDAPFGGTLQIGGHFGADFLPLSDNLYYTVQFSGYSGNPATPFNPASPNQILSPLFNKRYLLPTAALPKGKWESLNLGPFNGMITEVEDPSEAALVGTSVSVYQRPPSPDLTAEYWPFWDLMVIWNSTEAPNDLVILILEAYERVGGTDTSPELRKRVLTPSVNDYLPLQIDNRPPVPKLLDLETGFATFSSPTQVSSILSLDPCGEIPVTVGQINSNECILVNYSIQDGAGNAHPHVRDYRLSVKFTPRGGFSSRDVDLKPSFIPDNTIPPDPSVNYQSLNGNYTSAVSPIYPVQNFTSVLVPNMDDGWPPEPNGDPPSPCKQYAAAIHLRGSVRTVNGWGGAFSARSVSRFIIIKQ